MLEPRKVLVCGGAEFEPEFHDFSRNLGRALMRQTPFTLMTQGLQSTATPNTVGNDYIIAKAAEDDLKLLGFDPATRIQTILPEKPTPSVTRFSIGSEIVVPNTDARRRRYSATLMCDVMISMAGGPTTADIIDLAWLAGKPILPLAATRKASLAAWTKYGRPEIAKRLNISMDDANELCDLPATNNRLIELCIKTVKAVLRPHCFIAMQFKDPPFNDLYEVIRAVAADKGYYPLRADETQAGRELPNAISEAVRVAPVMIADLTYPNPNVYYEVGMSHAIGKQPLIIVHSENGDIPPNMPFDIRHRLILTYKDKDSLIKTLKERLPYA